MKLNVEQKKVKALRDFYATNYVRGNSDENFIAWIKMVLKETGTIVSKD